MINNQLRTLSHDALVDHVRTRLTGTPAAPTREPGITSRSGYVSLDGVPAVCIDVYPKRRRRETAGTSGTNHQPRGRPEVCGRRAHLRGLLRRRADTSAGGVVMTFAERILAENTTDHESYFDTALEDD
jgi:hypothetical protein